MYFILFCITTKHEESGWIRLNPISHWATVDTIIIGLVIVKFGLCVYVIENTHNKVEAREKGEGKERVNPE